MDWRPLSSWSSLACWWLWSIMALIVESARSKGRAKRSLTADGGGNSGPMWPASTGLLLTVVLFSGAFLPCPVGCGADDELRVQDYAVLAAVRDWESACEEPTVDADRDTPNLSELVTQSDVIFKAFAGHGNDLRDAALNYSAAAAAAASVAATERRRQQQQHHQPRWKANTERTRKTNEREDYVVRLEPGTVYKGNELFQQLQLNSWKHYFIIWSNGSVEYSHHVSVAAQSRPSGRSSAPPVDAASLDGSSVGAFAPGTSGPSSNTTKSNAFENVGHSSSTSRTLNCSAWRQRRRTAAQTTQPTMTEPSSSSEQPQPNARPRAETEDGSISSETAGFDRSVEQNDSTQEAPSPIGGARKRNPLDTNERVNFSHDNDAEGRYRAGVAVSKSTEKDSKTLGQISRTLNEILPVTVIVFGRLVRGSVADASDADNLLRVDPYVGLLLWDERLEDALWQALGWSKWSDYTGCSVGCGKGVQQRFRHCLQSGGSREQPTTSAFRRPASSRGSRQPSEPSPSSIERILSTPRQVSSNSAVEAHPPRSDSFGAAAPADGMLRMQPASVDEPPGASIIKLAAKSSPPRKGNLKPNRPPVGEKMAMKMMLLRRAKNGRDTMNRVPTEADATLSREVFGTRHTFPAPSQPSYKTHQPQTGDDGEGTWPPCEGHNIEQRSCNMFDCTGTIDLLTATDTHSRNWNEGIDDRINYEVNQLEQNFTLMISMRLRRHPESDYERPAAGRSATAATGSNILSVRSKLTTGPSLSINFVTDGHGGLRVIQEKYGLSEMLPVREPGLLDGEWHSLALSGRNGGGFVTVHADCRWINSFVLTKGSIELPQYPTIEVGRDIELRQLAVVPGEKSARLQCKAPAVPIRDVENRQVTNYFEQINSA